MSGCGETPLTGNKAFPVSATYEYVRNARLNQMPAPLWAVVQAFGGGDLSASEVTLQMGQALAAGANGFVLWKTDVAQKTKDADAWTAASSLKESIRYLQDAHELGVASADGAAIDAGNSSSLWSVLRTVEELIVVGVNLDCEGYDPAACSQTHTPHWTCVDSAAQTVNMTVPLDWQSMDGLKVEVSEIVNGKAQPVSFQVSLENGNRNLVFGDVRLDKDETTRVFLLSTQ